MLTRLFKPDTPSYQTLQNKEFRYFLSARFFLIFGLQIQAVVVGWEIYSITKDVLSLGYIGLAEAIPALSLALYGGHIADKLDRRKILIACYSVLLAAFAIIFSTSWGAPRHWFGRDYTLVLYSVIFVTGIARAFVSPAQFSLLPQLVPRELLPNGSTWSSSVWQIGAIVGPAAGGLVYAHGGMPVAMAIVVLMLGMAVFSIFRISPQPVMPVKQHESILHRLGTGLRFVFSNQVIIAALSLDLFSVLFGGAVSLLPAFADKVLNIGADGLGYLRAAPSIGSALMLMWLTSRKSFNRPGRTLLWCVAGFGICMIMFAVSRSFYLSLFFLFMSGIFDSVSVMIRSVILQLQTPDEMRGRVASVNTMFIGSSNEIGALESGVAARIFGLVPSVVLGGCMTLLVVGYTSIKAKSLKTLSFNQ